MGEVKTLGYLLNHYSDSQCYTQYIQVSWLEHEIEKLIEKKKDIGDVLVLLKHARQG